MASGGHTYQTAVDGLSNLSSSLGYFKQLFQIAKKKSQVYVHPFSSYMNVDFMLELASG